MIDERGIIKDERRPFVIDEAKFSTQKVVTYILLRIFSALVANVLIGQGQAERSTVMQTVINLTFLACGFWLGSSKSATDNTAALTNMAQPVAPLAPITPVAPVEHKP